MFGRSHVPGTIRNSIETYCQGRCFRPALATRTWRNWADCATPEETHSTRDGTTLRSAGWPIICERQNSKRASRHSFKPQNESKSQSCAPKPCRGDVIVHRSEEHTSELQSL